MENKTANIPDYKGARFYKCALQVNPWAYVKHHGIRSQYSNEDEYNMAIVEACQRNKIKVAGLANHGNVDSSEKLREILEEGKIVVFPGFEISSSEKIHMVCSYPENTDISTLNGYLAQLMGENYEQLKNDPTYSSSFSCEQIAGKIIDNQQGFWFAAHMTGKNGLLRLSGAGDNYVGLWKKDKLVKAGQIPGEFKGLEERESKIIKNLEHNYKRSLPIAVINAKDIDNPETLNCKSASCLIKMTKPNFEAFKDAFNDSKSRVCLNYDIDESPHSFIKSIQWDGAGFFEDNGLTFSKNLNTFIGGRGTGKSTLLESIRYTLGMEDNSNKNLKNLYKENFANSKITLTVVSKKQNQECYSISRRYGESPVIKNENEEISNLEVHDLLPEIKILGQNEILNIEKNEDEKMLLINKFLPDNTQLDENISAIKQKLAENREHIIKAKQEFDALDAKVSQKNKLTEQLTQFQKLGIAEKLKNTTFLTRENQIKNQIKNQFNEIQQWLDNYQSIFDLNFLAQNDITNMPNAKIISQTIKPLLNTLKTEIDGLVQQARIKLEAGESEYSAIYTDWEKKSGDIKDELNTAIAQLPEQAGKSGKELGNEYNNIITKLTSIEIQQNPHQGQRKILDTLEKERHALVAEYREIAFKRFSNMKKGVKQLNKSLANKLQITVKSMENRENLKNFLLNINGIGETKIKWLEDSEAEIDLIKWSKLIKDKDTDGFSNLYSNLGLTSGAVENLMRIDTETRLKMEEIELKDTIEIELNVAHEGSKEHYIAMEKLSTGQKCTAILSLLLLNQDDPLIIDQPEDNLDNAFIAERIVEDLRRTKKNRQFLFATHNANVPVFGDAELIAVLVNEERKGIIKYQGSIDDIQVKDQSAKILEGGEEAFNIRKKKYGF